MLFWAWIVVGFRLLALVHSQHSDPTFRPITVSDSGSPEIHGSYVHFTVMNDAPEYILEKDGRQFELYRYQAGTSWAWNIHEFTRDKIGRLSYTKSFFVSETDSLRPPVDGWMALDGKLPAPRVRCDDECCSGSNECPKIDGTPEGDYALRVRKFGMPSPQNLDNYLTRSRRRRSSYTVIENFLDDPMSIREFVLREATFDVSGNYPGIRTRSYATQELRNAIQECLSPLGGRITNFPMEADQYNGAYQFSTSRHRSWIHVDPHNNWAGILFLTPDAPHSAGTGLFRHRATGVRTQEEAHLRGVTEELGDRNQDYTEWELVDTIGNVFNRLVLFDSTQYHTSLGYFGTNKENGRLFQTFFFYTDNEPIAYRAAGNDEL